MGLARKKWQDAKARFRGPKDWEKKMQLTENFGPTLDTIESLMADVSAKIKTCGLEAAKLESTVKALTDAAKKYETNIAHSVTAGRAGLGKGLTRADGEKLLKALKDAVTMASVKLEQNAKGLETADYAVTRIIGEIEG